MRKRRPGALIIKTPGHLFTMSLLRFIRHGVARARSKNSIGLQRRIVKQKFKRTRNRGMPVGGEDEKQQWDFPLLFFRWVYRFEPPAKALSAAGQAVLWEIWRLQLRQRSRAMTVEIRVVTALEKMIPSRAKRRSISSSTGRKMRPFCMREVRVA